MAHPLLFLGVKLTEADDYRGRLAAVDVTRLGIPAQCTFSRNLDAFVFVTYGGLDAFCHIVTAVTEADTHREIKFPLLASILVADTCANRTAGPCSWLETLYRAPWYIEVRRLRNVINYGSVLAAPLNWPPETQCVTQWLAIYDRVLDTVEHSLALVLATAAP